MNPRPGEDELFGFLEGEMDALSNDRIVVHIETSPGCQERLERLTRGTPAACEVSTLETVLPGPDQIGEPAGSVRTRAIRGHGPVMPASAKTASAPSRSRMFAGWTTTASNNPSVSTRMCRLTPSISFPRAVPASSAGPCR